MSQCDHSNELTEDQNTNLPEETEELLSHILNFVEHLINLSVIDVRQLDIQVAEMNHLKYRININDQIAGEK
jgi:hypothetical protein